MLSLYNSKKGTGGPKASFGDVQYLNDILKKDSAFDVDKAYAVGGVRLQSFSDFVPHMYFDYMQLFAELAAKTPCSRIHKGGTLRQDIRTQESR